jgi:hypothetical protein
MNSLISIKILIIKAMSMKVHIPGNLVDVILTPIVHIEHNIRVVKEK